MCVRSFSLSAVVFYRLPEVKTVEKPPTISLGSLPSLQLSVPSQPNEYIDQDKFTNHHHRRIPSDASSKASTYRTGSSTTSHSPNTLNKLKQENEKNARSDGSVVSFQSNNYSLLSQTESDMSLKPGQGQTRLTGSAASSVHSSQQSIPLAHLPRGLLQSSYEQHGLHHKRTPSFASSISGIKEEDMMNLQQFEHPTAQLSYLHGHRHHPYQHQHVPLSISGSETEVRSPSEVGIFPLSVGLGHQPTVCRVIQA